MTWVAGCEECRGLWREYVDATTEHIRLGSKLQLAEMGSETEAIGILTPQLKSAAEKRQLSREAIRGHESQHGRASTAAN
jgi:hypothetical protein